MKHIFAIAILALALTGCHAPKTVTYMEGSEQFSKTDLAPVNPFDEPVIKPGDLLNIEVSASSYESVAMFNKGRYMTAEGNIQNNNYNNTDQNIRYYLVDKDGDIDFPLVGAIHVGGLKKSEVKENVVSAIYPKYIKEQPTVDVRIMNFSVTVLGQVKSPGIVTSTNERMTILEAIARVGDLDIRGERENIKIMRTNADGTREIAVVDIHDKNILNSPYYNLQQDDVIYVEPNRSAKQNSWQLPNAVGVTTTIVGSVSGIVALILTIVNL